MKAVRVHQFDGVDSLQYEEIPQPTPGVGQVLVQVKAAGVGPWDVWVREGQSVIEQALPLTPGSDLAGIIAAVGPDVAGFLPGDAVFGVTNCEFTGGYAEYAIAEAGMIAPKPRQIGFIEAASVPVVATSAWQMVYDYGGVDRTKRVLVLGAGGNVGAYAVQFAKRVGAFVFAAAFQRDADYLRTLGADVVIDVATQRFEEMAQDVDAVLDTVGGEMLDRSFAVLKRGGFLVSSVAAPDPDRAVKSGVRSTFFLVRVTSECLSEIAALLDTGAIKARVGEVLPLSEARLAHEMLAGKPHLPGKIVLSVDI